MNIKKLTLSIIAFFLMLNAHVVYTKDVQDDNNNSQIITSQDHDTLQNAVEYDEEAWKYIETMFQTVTDQTKKIEFCLQQVEQIINAGKINFNQQKTSKSAVLQEIKYIKKSIQFFLDICTKQLPKDDGIVKGTCFNTTCINYLLPIMKNDIMNININSFEEVIDRDFKALLTSLESFEQIPGLIETNTVNLQHLIAACDNIGLSTLNKVYRYLESTPLSLTGVPALTTLGNVSYWGGLGLLAYSTAVFAIPETFSFQIPYIMNKPQQLPGKSWIGSYDRVNTAINGVNEAERNKASQDLRGFDYVEYGLRTSTSSQVVVASLGILTAAVVTKWKEIKKSSIENWQATVNYVRGDANSTKNTNVLPKAYFKDMIGGEHLEKLARELADYLKNPTRYERAGITPSTGYLLTGPAQTGKSFFAKALKTLIDEAFEGTNEKVKFHSVSQIDVEMNGFTDIFIWARRNAPMILFIDEIDTFGARRDKNPKNTQELLTAINGIETDPSKRVIVIAATNRPEELDFALKQKGRLGTVITFDCPTYECRKAYLEKQLDKKNITLSLEMIDTIAQETDGQTYNMIDDIIRQALQLATFQTRPVAEHDFEVTLDREIRRIKPNTTMSIYEQELVALYQAGQATARHILATDQQIVKITIDTVDKPLKSKEGFGFITEQKGTQHENSDLLPAHRVKLTRLGFVFTMSKINNQELLSDEEQEKELMALLAGQAALELIHGKAFSGFGKEDRAKVLETLERAISQGNPITDTIRQQAIAAKDVLYQKVKKSLQAHTQFITCIMQELISKRTIDKKQWELLTANYTA